MQFMVCSLVFNVELSSLVVALDDDSLILQPLITSEEYVSSASVRQLMKTSVVNPATLNFETLPSVNKERLNTPDPRIMSFKALANLKDVMIVEELPDVCNNLWKDGLIWKGVYFRLISRVEGKALSAILGEMKLAANPVLKDSQITNNRGHPVYFETILYTLADLGSYFLFASPVIKSTSSEVLEDDSHMPWSSILDKIYEVEAEVPIKPNILAESRENQAVLNILLTLKSRNQNLKMVMTSKTDKKTPTRLVKVYPANIDAVFREFLPSISIASIKSLLSTVVSKGFKGFSMDSI
jgi:hypothetical protein